MKKIALFGLGLFLLGVSTNKVYAEDYAVVVGIDKYKQSGINYLVGAKNDALAYRDILLLNGVKEKNIKFLVNEDATKASIKEALNWVIKNIKSGDRFYYFHAGHGTSLRDNRGYFDGTTLKNINKTGVLLPYDYKDGDIDSLIITQNDLRPYFEKIDKKVSCGLLVFDACYSGFAYRGATHSIRKKTLISRDIPSLGIGNNKIKNYIGYPYQNTYALTASDSNHKSSEDPDYKRGIFTMALEGCIFESKKTYAKSLEICLDRRYLKQTYKFKYPNLNTNPLFFNLKDIKPVTKLTVLSQLNGDEFTQFANFVKKGVHDLELSYKNGVYTLYRGNGNLINHFKDKKELKRYLSNYRFIHQKGQKGGDIKIKVTQKGSNKNRDTLLVGSTANIEINSSIENHFLAIFTINKEGKLFMIEPIDRYREFYKNENLDIDVEAPIGTDFIKVILFEKENSLNKLEVNAKTGELLNDKKQIEMILNTLKNSKFYEVTKAIGIEKE